MASCSLTILSQSFLSRHGRVHLTRTLLLLQATADAQPLMRPQRSLGYSMPRAALRLDTTLTSQPSSQLGLLTERSLELPATPSPVYGLAQRSKCGPD